jgi:hypothetical protein
MEVGTDSFARSADGVWDVVSVCTYQRFAIQVHLCATALRFRARPCAVRVVDGTGARVLVHALIDQIHATAAVINEEVRDAMGRIVTVEESQIVSAIWLRCSVS